MYVYCKNTRTLLFNNNCAYFFQLHATFLEYKRRRESRRRKQKKLREIHKIKILKYGETTNYL